MSWPLRALVYTACLLLAAILSMVLVWVDSVFRNYLYGIELQHPDAQWFIGVVVITVMLWYFAEQWYEERN